MDSSYDIVIIGGGLVGVALMAALKPSPFRVLMIEKVPFEQKNTAHFDRRHLALSPSTVNVFNALSLWQAMLPLATPIKTIHISERGQFGRTCLIAKNKPALGYTIALPDLQKVLLQAVNLKDVLAPANLLSLDADEGCVVVQHEGQQKSIHAKLIIAADGADSVARKWCGLRASIKDFHQTALVANIGLARSHDYIAYERFHPSGPMAMLPLAQNQVAMIWAMSPEQAQAHLLLDENAFLAQLQKAFGYRLGRLMHVGERAAFPLKQVMMPKVSTGKVVFMGNAAHTLHPIAGQGFNLCVRDVAFIASLIMEHGVPPHLETYERARREDSQLMGQLTSGLVHTFAKDSSPLAALRGLGLLMLDRSSLLKKWLSYYASGYGGGLTDLVAGIPLSWVEFDDGA